MEETKIFDKQTIHQEMIKETIKTVANLLEEKGYDPVKQLSGYILSSDLGYITSYKDARMMISHIDINELLEFLIKEFIK